MRRLYLAGLFVFLVSCTVGVVATSPPPPPKKESIRRCGLGYAWIPGHWAWKAGKYVWIPGHCKKKPKARAIWVAGHWERRGKTWVWIPGHWR